jgi:Zn-dependent protease
LFSLVLPLLFLVMGGIGLPGGAVYIERERIRNRFMLSLMSLAGPLSNLLVAVILGLILRFSPSIPATYLPGLSFLLSSRFRRCFLTRSLSRHLTDTTCSSPFFLR